MDSLSSLLLLVAATTNCSPLFSFLVIDLAACSVFFLYSPAKVEVPYEIVQQRLKTMCLPFERDMLPNNKAILSMCRLGGS